MSAPSPTVHTVQRKHEATSQEEADVSFNIGDSFNVTEVRQPVRGAENTRDEALGWYRWRLNVIMRYVQEAKAAQEEDRWADARKALKNIESEACFADRSLSYAMWRDPANRSRDRDA